MKEVDFYLQPFNGGKIPHDITVSGRILRDPDRIAIRYELSGPLHELTIPAWSEKPARMDRLWESTCFELFLNPQDSKDYWEFNLSTSGQWNVYRFNGYREGMREEGAFDTLPFRVRTGPGHLGLDIEFNPGKIMPDDQAVNIAISAVLKSKNGSATYWALAHGGNKPDFHRRDGFIIEV